MNDTEIPLQKSFHKEKYGCEIGDHVTFAGANPNVIYRIKRFYTAHALGARYMAHLSRQEAGKEPDYNGAGCLSLEADKLIFVASAPE